MTEPQPLEKDRESRHWILQTFGLAFGVGLLMVVIVFGAVMALESPSNRRAAVSAAPIATATPSDATEGATLRQAVTEAPVATAGPTRTPVTMHTVAAAPTQTSFVVSLPLVASLAKRTIAQAPTRTPLPTATTKSVARSVATRTVALKSSAPVQRLPAATATPIRQLDFSFYVKETCATEPTRQILKLMITARGGIPPYDYYNDATQLGQAVAGSVVLEVNAPLGNPVPFKLIVVDKTGQRYSETFFYKSTIHCYW